MSSALAGESRKSGPRRPFSGMVQRRKSKERKRRGKRGRKRRRSRAQPCAADAESSSGSGEGKGGWYVGLSKLAKEEENEECWRMTDAAECLSALRFCRPR